MVQQTGEGDVFQALAHDVRRDMLARLSDRELSVGELAEPLAMSFAAASKHVRVLEDAGLVRRQITGRRHVLRLESAGLDAVHQFLGRLEQHWTRRLDALEAVLTDDEKQDEGNQS